MVNNFIVINKAQSFALLQIIEQNKRRHISIENVKSKCAFDTKYKEYGIKQSIY
jgi:hypothetical protein